MSRSPWRARSLSFCVKPLSFGRQARKLHGLPPEPSWGELSWSDFWSPRRESAFFFPTPFFPFVFACCNLTPACGSGFWAKALLPSVGRGLRWARFPPCPLMQGCSTFLVGWYAPVFVKVSLPPWTALASLALTHHTSPKPVRPCVFNDESANLCVLIAFAHQHLYCRSTSVLVPRRILPQLPSVADGCYYFFSACHPPPLTTVTAFDCASPFFPYQLFPPLHLGLMILPPSSSS